MDKKCKYKDCTNNLEKNHHNLKYCTEHQKLMRSNRKHNYNRICKVCNNKFVSKNGHAVICPECKECIVCSQCNNKTKRTANYQKYCSKECSNQAKMEFYYEGNYRKVLERDNNKCRKCESTIKLTVHHIDYSGFYLKRDGIVNNGLDNLILLCDTCHQNLHTITNRTIVQNHLDEAKEILKNFIENKDN
jgi:hypothetical protein